MVKHKTENERIYECYLNTLKESPNRIGFGFPDLWDHQPWNKEQAEKIINNVDKNVIQKDIITIGNIKFNIFIQKDEDSDGAIYTLNLIDSRTPTVAAYIMYKEVDFETIESLGIWNSVKYKGSVRYLFLNWLIKKYNRIISDGNQTTQGERFWRRLFDDIKTDSSLVIYGINVATEITKELKTSFDIDELYDKVSRFHWRFCLQRIK